MKCKKKPPLIAVIAVSYQCSACPPGAVVLLAQPSPTKVELCTGPAFIQGAGSRGGRKEKEEKQIQNHWEHSRTHSTSTSTKTLWERESILFRVLSQGWEQEQKGHSARICEGFATRREAVVWVQEPQMDQDCFLGKRST